MSYSYEQGDGWSEWEQLDRKKESWINWINDEWASCPTSEPVSYWTAYPPGLSRPVETTSSTLEPLRLAFMMRSSVTSDQKTSSRLWWKSSAMAFSRLLSSRVYSERCGKTWRMSMRLANNNTGSGPVQRNKRQTGMETRWIKAERKTARGQIKVKVGKKQRKKQKRQKRLS